MKAVSTNKQLKITSKKLSKVIAEFAFGKKADDIVILDVRKVANFCDYFVICTAHSDRQIRAVINGIEEGLEKLGIKLRHKQGLKQAKWAFVDLGDIIVHVFDKPSREFYGLDYLWKDAVRIDWENNSTRTKTQE